MSVENQAELDVVWDDHHVSAVGELRGIDLVRHVDNPRDVTVKVFAHARDTMTLSPDVVPAIPHTEMLMRKPSCGTPHKASMLPSR